MRRSSSGETDSSGLVSPSSMISPATLATGPSSGVCTFFGSISRARAIRSATSWRARKMSSPNPNSAQTIDNPEVELDRMRRRPGTPLIAVSSGKLTAVSTSSAA